MVIPHSTYDLLYSSCPYITLVSLCLYHKMIIPFIPIRNSFSTYEIDSIISCRWSQAYYISLFSKCAFRYSSNSLPFIWSIIYRELLRYRCFFIAFILSPIILFRTRIPTIIKENENIIILILSRYGIFFAQYAISRNTKAIIIILSSIFSLCAFPFLFILSILVPVLFTDTTISPFQFLCNHSASFLYIYHVATYYNNHNPTMKDQTQYMQVLH